MKVKARQAIIRATALGAARRYSHSMVAGGLLLTS